MKVGEVDTKEDDGGSIRETLEAAFAENTATNDTATEGTEPKGTSKEIPKQAATSNAEIPKSGDDKSSDANKPIEPPARWTKEQKEEFAALDPQIQKILLSRNKGLEGDYTRKMGEIAQERQRYHRMESVLAPRRETWARQGMDDAQFINSLFSYWDLAQRDAGAFIDQFARERGIDLAAMYAPSPEQLAQYFGGQQYNGDPDAQQPAVHPAVLAQLQSLAQQQQQLQSVIAGQQQTLAQRQQAESTAMVNAAKSEMQQFAEAKNEHGEPLYPFFEDVRKDMAKLMQSGFADTLQDAYDRAVRIRPDVYKQIEESREITRRREDESRRQEEAAKARRAGASVSSSLSSTPSRAAGNDDDDDGLSIRELIEKQFKAANVGARI